MRFIQVSACFLDLWCYSKEAHWFMHLTIIREEFMLRKLSLLLAVVVVAGLVAALPAYAAVSTSFEGFGLGTPGAALGIPGVTFDGGEITTGFFSWNGPGDTNVLIDYGEAETAPGTLAPAPENNIYILFDEPQGGVTFDWSSCDVPLGVTALLHGVAITSRSFNGSVPPGFDYPEGTVSLTGPLDEVHLSAECFAIDHVATYDLEVAVPGCDVLMRMPSNAVVGSFVADAPAYWAPGQLVENPTLTIPAGKTAWVLGVDSTGEYYQIVWVCDYLWVPRGSMGPNYDEVWNGAPLPTDVVD